MAIHETQLTTTSTQAAYHVHVVKYACALCRKMVDCTYGFQRRSAGSLQRRGFREKLTIFLPLLPAEYVTGFSGRTDPPEVRFDLTDTQTDRPNYSNPPAHARRVNKLSTHSVSTNKSQRRTK